MQLAVATDVLIVVLRVTENIVVEDFSIREHLEHLCDIDVPTFSIRPSLF